MALPSISEVVSAASGFLARGALRPGARPPFEERTGPRSSATRVEEPGIHGDAVVLGRPFCEAVAAALREAGYLDAR